MYLLTPHALHSHMLILSYINTTKNSWLTNNCECSANFSLSDNPVPNPIGGSTSEHSTIGSVDNVNHQGTIDGVDLKLGGAISKGDIVFDPLIGGGRGSGGWTAEGEGSAAECDFLRGKVWGDGCTDCWNWEREREREREEGREGGREKEVNIS